MSILEDFLVLMPLVSFPKSCHVEKMTSSILSSFLPNLQMTTREFSRLWYYKFNEQTKYLKTSRLGQKSTVFNSNKND